MSRLTTSAWTLGIMLLAFYAQLPGEIHPHLKHARVTGQNNHRLDALAPMPDFAEDQTALALSQITPVIPPQVYKAEPVTPPTRYEKHQVEVWNGSHRETVAVWEPQKVGPRGVQQFRNTQAYRPQTQTFITPNLPNIVPRYWQQVSAVIPQTPAPASLFHRIEKRKGVSDSFAQEIDQALSTIPLNQVNALNRKGYRIVLSRKLTDVVPSARNQQVRGYEASTTWNSVYGMFNRTTKRVVMAELAERNLLGKNAMVPLTDRKRRLGIVRHEFGHAVDQYLGNFSHSPKFQAAFMRDVQSLNESEKEALSYFLQPGNAGFEETFAELYACLNGDGCDPAQDQVLRDHFGDLLSMIQTRVSRIRG